MNFQTTASEGFWYRKSLGHLWKN